LGSAKEKAHVAEAQAKVREVNTMVQMYIDDNNGTEPKSLKFGEYWVNYGKLPASSGTNHITYSYSDGIPGDGNYTIIGKHDGPGTAQDETYICDSQEGCY